jgi:putative transposase
MDGTMASKRHKLEEIVAKLRQADVLTGEGKSIAEAVKTIAVTETTYFRWRAEYCGMKSDQVKRLKELELENTRLRRAVSDLTLDKLILTEAARGTSKPRPSPGLRRQSPPRPDCRAASINTQNALARQSLPRDHGTAATPDSHPDCRCPLIQIVARQNAKRVQRIWRRRG